VRVACGSGHHWYINDRTGRPLTLVDDNAVALIRVKKPGAYKTPDESVVRYHDETEGWIWADSGWVWTTWSGPGPEFAGPRRSVRLRHRRARPGTKLYYTSERWYDAESGRYLNENPNGLAGRMPIAISATIRRTSRSTRPTIADGFTKAVDFFARRGGTR